MENDAPLFGSCVKENDRPRRKSSRLQCAPPEIKEEPRWNNTRSWKPTEKLALLEALKEYGSADPKKLANKVKTRSVNEIKYFLNTNMDRIRNAHYKSLAETAEKAEVLPAACSEEEEHYRRLAALAPIDLWKRIVTSNIPLKSRVPDYSLVLAEIFKELGEQEEELDIPYAPNFKALYKFIEDTLRGSIPADLSPVDACVMDFLLTELSKIMEKQEASAKFIEEFDGPVAYVPSSIVDGEEEYNSSKTVSKKMQNSARRMVAGKKKELIRSVPDKAYEYYHLHQKIRDNLNPMGIHPWLLQESSDIIIDHIKERFPSFTPP